MELARRFLLAGLALTAVACARRCGGLGGQPPIGDAVKVIGPDGQEVLLVDKGAYKAWYDKWGRLGRIEFRGPARRPEASRQARDREQHD